MVGRRPRRFCAFAAFRTFQNDSGRFHERTPRRRDQSAVSFAVNANHSGSLPRTARCPAGALSPIGDRHVYPPLYSRSCGACEHRNRRDLRFRVGPRQVRILRRPSLRRRFRRRSDAHLHAAARTPVRNGCPQSAAVAAAAIAVDRSRLLGSPPRRRAGATAVRVRRSLCRATPAATRPWLRLPMPQPTPARTVRAISRWLRRSPNRPDTRRSSAAAIVHVDMTRDLHASLMAGWRAP